MKALNKDTVIALLLLAIAALFFWETYNIPTFEYASIGSEVWPRIILVPLFILCGVYFFQSLRNKSEATGPRLGIGGIIVKYRNPILSFLIFFLFLLTVDFLGMLIGGSLLVFALLTVLGHRSPKYLLLHAVIAVVSVGAVWSLFTFALRVYLPEGEILRLY
jgi:putative tricarboxylic transport membrane protein